VKKTNDPDMVTGSGLLRGSEPLRDVQHRSAAKRDDDDSKDDSDKGDDDSTDTDKTDTDLTDKKGDSGDDSRDSDGKD
jgi:hypothetical protein